MNDLEKLEEIYDSIEETMQVIEKVGELSDYDLDCGVNKIYNTIDDAQTSLYDLITEIRTGGRDLND